LFCFEPFLPPYFTLRVVVLIDFFRVASASIPRACPLELFSPTTSPIFQLVDLSKSPARFCAGFLLASRFFDFYLAFLSLNEDRSSFSLFSPITARIFLRLNYGSSLLRAFWLYFGYTPVEVRRPRVDIRDPFLRGPCVSRNSSNPNPPLEMLPKKKTLLWTPL